MSDGLRCSHFILGKAPGRRLASRGRGELCSDRDLPPSTNSAVCSQSPGPVPVLCPGQNYLPKHPRTSSSRAEGRKPALCIITSHENQEDSEWEGHRWTTRGGGHVWEEQGGG